MAHINARREVSRKIKIKSKAINPPGSPLKKNLRGKGIQE